MVGDDACAPSLRVPSGSGDVDRPIRRGRSQLVLREGTLEDDEAITRCIGESFPRNPKARNDVLQWQYRDNPFGTTSTWVWDDDGRIVAHYSAFPMPYLLDGDRVIGANAVDAAVAPSHQGQRLFTPLAKALYGDCAAKGRPVVICYATNAVAMRGVARAGVEWKPALRVLALPRLRGRVHGDEVDGPPESVDDLWARMVAAGGIRNGVDRGAAWWRWRYAASALGPYRYFAAPGAAAVVVQLGRFGCVLELVAADPSAAARLLRGASAVSRLGLVTLAVDGGPLYRLARASGMVPVPRRLIRRPAHYGLVATEDQSLAGRTWHVGWGDMDHL